MEEKIRVEICPENPAIKVDESKCIKCGKCLDICRNEVTVSRMYDLGITKKPICINCGQCSIYCPTEAISEKEDYEEINKILKKNDKVVTFSVAPAVRVALGEEFGMKIGTNIDKKMVGALKKIGANYVFDVTFSADLTIMEEAMELVNRIKQNKNLPLFTSCCPAWVKYAELFYPELLSNISTCKSPISMQGTIIKTYFAKKINFDPNNIVNVIVAPCTAKKAEIKRKELSITNQDNDYVITTRELAKLLKEHNINLEECKEEEFDSPLGDGSGAGVIFGNTGGVTEAAFRTAYYCITGKDLKDDELVFSEVRGMNGIKNIEVNIDGINIKGAVVNGMKNLKKVLDIIKEDSSSYQFIEVMNCNGGCIAGGGQPKTTLLNMLKTKEARIGGLYSTDEKMVKRVSYKNPEIKKIYEEFFKEPNSDIAHKYLHTTYTDKSEILKGGACGE